MSLQLQNPRQQIAVSQPSDNGLLVWTFDPQFMADTGIALVPGQVYLAKVKLLTAQTVTNILGTVKVAGASLTAAYAALFDAGGIQRGITADQSSVWNSTGVKTMALTTPYAAAAGTYYVALFVTGTTAPQFARASGGSTATPNAGLVSGSYRFNAYGSGLTSVPGTVTLASAGASGSAYWLGLS